MGVPITAAAPFEIKLLSSAISNIVALSTATGGKLKLAMTSNFAI
jgi:hypothetical protein